MSETLLGVVIGGVIVGVFGVIPPVVTLAFNHRQWGPIRSATR